MEKDLQGSSALDSVRNRTTGNCIRSHKVLTVFENYVWKLLGKEISQPAGAQGPERRGMRA